MNMFSGNRYRWVLILVCFAMAAIGGLFFGKWKEKDSISRMYARTDFTLLTDKGEFFQLSKLSKDKLLLLVFTPDELSPKLVKAFHQFFIELPRIEKLGIEVKMITRTNREIARNFKQAAGFDRDLLIDTSGTVGRNLGIWPDLQPVDTWGYGLLNSQMQLFWAATDTQPMTVSEIIDELKKVGARFQASGANEKESGSTGAP